MAIGRSSRWTNANPTGWAMACSIFCMVPRCSGFTGLWVAKASIQVGLGVGEMTTAGSASKRSWSGQTCSRLRSMVW